MATSQERDFISARDAAKKHGLSFAWVKRLAQRGQIPGAFKLGERAWAVPSAWIPERKRSAKPD